jgi:hypothetical protein
MSRPAGNVPILATDALYPAGADPWSASPTKVDPGTVAVAAGYQPNAKLPAQEYNWLLNRLGTWIDYQDRLEAQNFGAPFEEFTSAGEKIRTDTAHNAIAFNPALKKYFVGGASAADDQIPVVYTSVSGAPNTWDDDSAPVRTPAGNTQTYRFVTDPTGRLLAWISELGPGYFYLRTAGGVWSTASVNQPSSFVATVARYYPRSDTWLVGGAISSVPKIYSTTPSDVWTSQTLTSATSGGITDLAVSATHAVAIDDTGEVWAAAALGTWTYTSAASFSSRPTSVVFVAPEAVFWLLCEAGHVYTSPDGVTWTLTADPATFLGSEVIQFLDGGTATRSGASAAFGGLVLASCTVTTPEPGDIGQLAIGWNGGTQWDLVNPPVTANAVANTPARVISLIGDRVAILSQNGVSGTSGFRMAMTLRV